MTSAPIPWMPRPSHVGSAVLASVMIFFTTCTTAQVLRTDLDWSRDQLSFYLMGEYGWAVKSAYFVLGASLMLMGLGYYHALSAQARSLTSMWLFASAGIALMVTALADSHTGGRPIPVEGIIHGLAASLAFLCITSAMLLQAWRLRADALWRHRFGTAFGMAVFAVGVMWVHVLWREAPRGLSQKFVITMILAWIAMAAWWLRNHREPVALPVETPVGAEAAAGALAHVDDLKHGDPK